MPLLLFASARKWPSHKLTYHYRIEHALWRAMQNIRSLHRQISNQPRRIMMKIQIKFRWSDRVLFEGEYESLKHAVVAAVGQRADLEGADLEGADLKGAYLKGAY